MHSTYGRRAAYDRALSCVGPGGGQETLVTGIHHITLCPGSAQEDLDFFTGVLAQRLVKQTVLLDGNIPVYHFYYGNADAEPGSIRGDLALSMPDNLVHGSDSPQSAEREIGIWFSDDDLV